jgi:hypothetical protein
MTALETAAVQAFAKEFVDVILPQIVAAEEAKLPAAYAPLAAAITSALMPQIVAALDAKIAAL